MPVLTRAVLPLFVLLGLAACETVEGAGETIQNTGEFVEDESNEVQDDL